MKFARQWDWKLVDRLQDKRQFIHQKFHIHGDCAAAEEAEDDLAEISKVDDKKGRELYMGAGDREHD